MTDLDEVRQAITSLESQRATLGDLVVDTALASLREKLAALEEQGQEPRQERRLVTVLFADIVGSTAMSLGLEPDEIMEIMEGALKRLSIPVEQHGGRVTRYMGDGFKALFGMPVAHENDAKQAVRAGLGILEAARTYAEVLAKERQIRGFDVRVGINTGLVAAGGFSEAEDTVSGLTLNLAARLESAAPAGGLLISHGTYQHVRGAFDVEPQEPIGAKGFPEPVPAYLVTRAKPRTFYTVTRGVQGVETRMIGRSDELLQLQSTFGRAMQRSETQIVTVVGDAGIGKSRLLHEFDQWLMLSHPGVVPLKGRASSQTMRTPFSLLHDLFAHRFEILHNDPAEVTCQKLEAGLGRFFEAEPQMKAHFIGALAGYDFAGSPHLVGVQDGSSQLRERALFYLTQLFVSASEQAPTVVMLDDIHWADEASLDAITHILRECPRLRLLVVCLARPIVFEIRPGWDQDQFAGEARNTRLNLVPLPGQASRQLVSEILKSDELLPEALNEQIVSTAEGNPYHVEELIQMMISDGVIERDERGDVWQLDPNRMHSLHVPATLTAVLQARLDGLPPEEKLVLQQASIVGRTFWNAVIAALQGGSHLRIPELATLSRRELIHEQEGAAFVGTDEYIFRHGLMRDVVYDTVFKRVRKAYHGQVAAWLVEVTEAAGRSGEYAGVIAEHYELAGERSAAVDWYLRAGDRARAQGAPQEARRFFDRALALLTPGDLERRWRVLVGRDEVLGTLGETDARRADGAALVELAQEMRDDGKLAEAYRRQGYALGLTGQYRDELLTYEKALAAARRAGNREIEALVLGLMVVCQTRLGEMQLAAETATEALARAQELGDEGILVRNLTNVAVFYTEGGDIAESTRLLEQQVAINHRLGIREGEVVGLTNLGYNYLMLGLYPEGITTLERSVVLCEAIGHRHYDVFSRLNLGLAYIRIGEVCEAQRTLAGCLPELVDMNNLFGQAAGQSYLALAKEHSGEIEGALQLFSKARATFEDIGVPGYAHDALAGLARCLLTQRRLEEVGQHVAELWDYLAQGGAEGMEFPVMAYQTCADVFDALGDTERARAALEAGYGELVARADKISDAEWRRSFLENVPEHRSITVRWQQVSQQ